MAIETTKAEGYQKRADAAGERLPTRSGPAYLALQRRQRALDDMADNEDLPQNQRVALARNLLVVEEWA